MATGLFLFVIGWLCGTVSAVVIAVTFGLSPMFSAVIGAGLSSVGSLLCVLAMGSKG